MVETKKAFADAALIDVFAAMQPQPILTYNEACRLVGCEGISDPSEELVLRTKASAEAIVRYTKAEAMMEQRRNFQRTMPEAPIQRA